MDHRRSVLRSGSLALATAVLVVLATARPAGAQIQEGLYLPLAPETLLGFLPKNASGWKLTRSTAQTEMTNWINSKATRAFEEIPSPDAPADAGPPGKVSITILDTGGPSAYTRSFANFVVGDSGGEQRIMIDSYPAIVTKGENNEVIVTMFVEKRFIVTYTLENQDLKELKPWLQACNFTGLKKIPEPALVDKPPAVIDKVMIDELDPSKNFRYQVHK